MIMENASLFFSALVQALFTHSAAVVLSMPDLIMRVLAPDH